MQTILKALLQRWCYRKCNQEITSDDIVIKSLDNSILWMLMRNFVLQTDNKSNVEFLKGENWIIMSEMHELKH
jgi:hypothetical protein